MPSTPQPLGDEALPGFQSPTGDARPDDSPTSAETRRFEEVAEEVFRRYGRNWKPRTVSVNRSYLRNQILPWFRQRLIAEITRSDVQNWLGTLHATPAAADRSLPILSVSLRQAEIYGYRMENSNPCTGVRRRRPRARERFLTTDETRRLGAALAAREADSPVRAAAVRLLLLTGCRQGEIRELHWQDYRSGHLFLRDSKTGPRTVWLSSPARAVLDRLPRTRLWVFPAANGLGPLSTGMLDRFWRTLRESADLPGLPPA